MLDRTLQMFDYTNLPETIPKRMLETYLQCYGYVCIARPADASSTQVENSTYPLDGLYAYYGTLGGVPDVYYQPTICVVSNPAQQMSHEYHIDTDCVIVRSDSNYQGMLPVNRRYATLLAENYISIRMAEINKRIEWFITTTDDTERKSANNFLQKLEQGDLATLASSQFFEGLQIQESNTTNNSITALIELHQYLSGKWFNEVGVQDNYNMKREALSANELGLNVSIMLPLVENMLEERRIGFDKVNAMFGTDIHVKLSSVWEQTFKEEKLSIEIQQANVDEQAANADLAEIQVDQAQQAMENPDDSIQVEAEENSESSTQMETEESEVKADGDNSGESDNAE